LLHGLAILAREKYHAVICFTYHHIHLSADRQEESSADIGFRRAEPQGADGSLAGTCWKGRM
jgi:hypothetical protein